VSGVARLELKASASVLDCASPLALSFLCPAIAERQRIGAVQNLAVICGSLISKFTFLCTIYRNLSETAPK
jgi:hypothetical protein